jgi:Ala-tRNA(Pro) deacylase
MSAPSLSNLPATRDELFARLAKLGIATRTVEHPPLFTVAESSAIERDLPGGHTKNLFLKDAEGSLFLIVALAETKIDLKSLPKVLRCGRLSFGKPELLAEALGVKPGSVTAFAVMNDTVRRVSVIVDQALFAHETVNCHPLENTATTNIALDELLRFIRASGHEPRVVKLAG